MLAFDGRFDLADVVQPDARDRLKEWVTEAAGRAAVSAPDAKRLRGAVFEVRQGYKSKDAKRQNADVGNASSAYISAYLPIIAMLSNQIDDGVVERYLSAKWVLLRGTTEASPFDSTYSFCRDVLGFDLSGFFTRNTHAIRREVEDVIEKLLRAA